MYILISIYTYLYVSISTTFVIYFLVPVEDGKKRKAEEEEEMSEAEEMSEDSDFNPSDAEESGESSESSSSGSESGSEVEEVNLKRKKVSKVKPSTSKKQKVEKGEKTKTKSKDESTKKRKKVSFEESKKVKKQKQSKESDETEEKDKDEEKDDSKKDKKEEGEEGFDPSNIDPKDANAKKGAKKREAPLFNDKNLDYNLFNDAPENVVAKKIKISNTVLVTCKMIDAITGGASGGLSYDYAALTFLRKIQNQKAFEFNLPLTLAPKIIEALKLIIKDNPKFFKKHLTNASE